MLEVMQSLFQKWILHSSHGQNIKEGFSACKRVSHRFFICLLSSFKSLMLNTVNRFLLGLSNMTKISYHNTFCTACITLFRFGNRKITKEYFICNCLTKKGNVSYFEYIISKIWNNITLNCTIFKAYNKIYFQSQFSIKSITTPTISSQKSISWYRYPLG